MLPIHEQFGVRLAAILPTAVSMLTGQPTDPELPTLKSTIVLVVDGLGWHNLEARRGHARTLARLAAEPIATVFPTTTGAALTTITTGVLPGEHGLVGYRIRHPRLGLRVTLSQWQDIRPVRSWQTHETVFERAGREGVTSHVVGRAAHATGGLTEAILTGATYHSADTIEDRCARAIALAHAATAPTLIYVYVDELDRAGHRFGWQSDEWILRLEQLDASVTDLLRRIPPKTGFVATADHGMVDVAAEDHILLDEQPSLLDGVSEVGGEPRLRYLYLDNTADAEAVALRLQGFCGDRATVFTRDDAIRMGLYGPVREDLRDRIGDVIIAATGLHAMFVAGDGESSMRMIGHHGSTSESERHVPLLVGGAIPAVPFFRATS